MLLRRRGGQDCVNDRAPSSGNRGPASAGSRVRRFCRQTIPRHGGGNTRHGWHTQAWLRRRKANCDRSQRFAFPATSAPRMGATGDFLRTVRPRKRACFFGLHQQWAQYVAGHSNPGKCCQTYPPLAGGTKRRPMAAPDGSPAEGTTPERSWPPFPVVDGQLKAQFSRTGNS